MTENIDVLSEKLVNSTLQEVAKELETKNGKLSTNSKSSASLVSLDTKSSFEQVSLPSKQSSSSSWEKETFAVETAKIDLQEPVARGDAESDGESMDYNFNETQEQVVGDILRHRVKPAHKKPLVTKVMDFFNSSNRNTAVDIEEPYNCKSGPVTKDDDDLESLDYNIESQETVINDILSKRKAPNHKRSLILQALAVVNIELVASYVAVLSVLSVAGYLIYDPTIIALAFSSSIGLFKWMTSHLVKFVILHAFMNYAVVRLFPVI